MAHLFHCTDGNTKTQGREDAATCPRSYRNLVVSQALVEPSLPSVLVAALGGSQGITTQGRKAMPSRLDSPVTVDSWKEGG